MAADAIRGYLESLAKDGLPIRPEDPASLGNIIKETGIRKNRGCW